MKKKKATDILPTISFSLIWDLKEIENIRAFFFYFEIQCVW
jgi:hypothetical protein